MTAAVILGGGFAGMLAAEVLARHVDAVTIIESGWYPAGPGTRPGLPQAHHNHVLIADGARALETLLPGIGADLYARGAHRRGLTGETLILSSHGWFRRYETGAYVISCSRWLIDHAVRQRVLARRAVSVRARTRALGLTGDASRVTGVIVRPRGGRAETIQADIVIDATGRWSRAARWLAEIGGHEIEEVTIRSGAVYSTRLFQAPAGLAAGIPAVMIHPRLTGAHPDIGATLFPIEGGRWIVTLTGNHGAEPPSDERGFTDFALSLPSTIVAELMAAAAPAGGVLPYRATASTRRFFDRARLPDGFLAVGDAVVAVNPVYSHGMSVAALGALRLDIELTQRGAGPEVFPGIQPAIAAAAERSWWLATGRTALAADGKPRAEAQLERRARIAMTRVMLGSRVLMAEFFRVQALVPTEGPDPMSVSREMSRDPQPLLSTEAAVAQYPSLSVFGGSRVRRRSADSPCDVVRQSRVFQPADLAGRHAPALSSALRWRAQRVVGPAGPAARGHGHHARSGPGHPGIRRLP